MNTKRSSDLKPFPKWTGMVTRYSQQRSVPMARCNKEGYQPCEGLTKWRNMVQSAKGKPKREQLKIVNNWSNKHTYIIDQINWGVVDYWETPNEFMTVFGDCEDYAISKYYSLRKLGFSKNDMKIVILQDFNLGGIIHAVLSVKLNGKEYILDNQARRVIEAAKIYHYRPIFAINESAWWFYNPS